MSLPKILTGSQLEQMAGGRLVGTVETAITGVASLSNAGTDKVSFLANMKYKDQVSETKAGVVFIPETYEGQPATGQAFIFCKDPSGSFQKAVDFFAPPPVQYPAGRHPAAVVAATAVVPASCHIGPHAVIEAGVVLGERTVISANSFIGTEAKIGDDCLIHPNATIRERCVIGNRCIIHSGTVVGSDGFGYLSGPQGHSKIPQVGIVELHDDVELGSQVAVDRARFGKTVIGRGTKVDNLVQIAHNVEIGQHCFIVSQVGIAGSTVIGNWCVLAGQVGVAGHVRIGDKVTVMAQSGIPSDVASGSMIIGSPAVDRKEFARQLFNLHAIPQVKDNVKELQRQLIELKAEIAAMRAAMANP
jgi:UDP-3-O-[3-hydroxymyristoyl] glucosamine N-acyltransferase